MSTQTTQPAVSNQSAHVPAPGSPRPPARVQRNPPAPLPFRSMARLTEDISHRDAELFYLQKQIQSQTPMVIVLEDGEHIEGCIEWYDRNALKVRGRAKILIYKSAIKYMYKLGDHGQ
jgi:sRNA-binding regulator protein Hfq